MKAFDKEWKFRGIPTKKEDRRVLGNMKIYTDLKSQGWRVQRFGDKGDKKFSWKQGAKVAKQNWKKMIDYISSP